MVLQANGCGLDEVHYYYRIHTINVENLEFKDPLLFTLSARRVKINRTYRSCNNHPGFELRLLGVKKEIEVKLSHHQDRFIDPDDHSLPQITRKELVSNFDKFYPHEEIKSRLSFPGKKPLNMIAKNPREDGDDIIFDLDSRRPKKASTKFESFMEKQLWTNIVATAENKNYRFETRHPSRWETAPKAIRDNNLDGARLINARLQGYSFEGRNIHQTDFRYSKLKNANFQRVTGKFTWFRGADLRYASFDGNQLKRAGFEYSDLRGATGLDLNSDSGFSHARIVT